MEKHEIEMLNAKMGVPTPVFDSSGEATVDDLINIMGSGNQIREIQKSDKVLFKNVSVAQAQILKQKIAEYEKVQNVDLDSSLKCR